MSGIKAVNSKNISVENCIFSGFETDIELHNVEGFVSKNNKFSRDNDPRLLLHSLSKEILNSSLDKTSKERLVTEINNSLSGKITSDKEKSVIKSLRYVGEKAVDLFVQLTAAVAAGLIIKS